MAALKIGKLYTCDKGNGNPLYLSGEPNEVVAVGEPFVVLGCSRDCGFFTVRLLTAQGTVALAVGCKLDWFKRAQP